jgi:hypothetical protein
MIFKYIYAEIFGDKIGDFYTNYWKFLQKIDHNNGFREKRHFLPKIGKNRQKL